MFSQSNTVRRLASIGLLACALASSFAFAGQHSKAAAKTQTVAVSVDNGFKPNIIKVHHGQPVKLVFNGVNPGCVDKVVFKGLNITKKVMKGQKTVVMFTPKKAGTINFACGMGMMTGKVLVR